MNEIWKPIEGWEGLYEVSNLGRVKSLPRTVKRGISNAEHHLKERVLKIFYNCFGRSIIGLHREGEGQTTLQVSRLVAKTFIENPNALPDINHIDGDCTNNRIDNLEWCTKSDNLKHAWATGLKKHYTTSFSENDIKKMRLYRKAGMPTKLISEIFGCSYPYASNICNRRFRNDIDDDLEYIMF